MIPVDGYCRPCVLPYEYDAGHRMSRAGLPHRPPISLLPAEPGDSINECDFQFRDGEFIPRDHGEDGPALTAEMSPLQQVRG
jgi:hypothetical protein